MLVLDSNFPSLKKGISGITMLIVFLSIVVVVVFISSIFLTSAGKLSGDATKMKQSIDKQSRQIHILEIAGFDGRDGSLTSFTMDLKLDGASPPMDLNSLTLELLTGNFLMSLRNRGGGVNANNNSGYNTWAPEELGRVLLGSADLPFTIDAITESLPYNLPVDLDGDGLTDSVYTCSGSPCPDSYTGTHLRFDLSSTSTDYYARLVNASGIPVNISASGTSVNVVKAPITGNFGYVTVIGTTGQPNRIGYGGETAIIYRWPEHLDADLDDDGLNDSLYVNATHVIVDVSSVSNEFVFPFNGNITSVPFSLNVQADINVGTNQYGDIAIVGTTTTSNEIDASVTFTITPYLDGRGYYYTEYLKYGDHPLDQHVTSGDVVRLYFETYSEVNDSQEMTFTLHTNDQSTIKGLYTGETIPGVYKVALYPKP